MFLEIKEKAKTFPFARGWTVSRKQSPALTIDKSTHVRRGTERHSVASKRFYSHSMGRSLSTELHLSSARERLSLVTVLVGRPSNTSVIGGRDGTRHGGMGHANYPENSITTWFVADKSFIRSCRTQRKYCTARFDSYLREAAALRMRKRAPPAAASEAPVPHHR